MTQKKAKKKGIFLIFHVFGPNKKNATLIEPLQRTCMPIFRPNEQFSREE